jgi:lipid-A-disaccharide synthase
VVLSVAPTIELRDDEVPFPLVRSASFDVLRAADVALCKSGTTTLEAAVAGCPCAIVYRTSRSRTPSPSGWCASRTSAC